jgi:NAD(P)-dependent dehydrogenase (short-subunit alcohol dehydrogenase family)
MTSWTADSIPPLTGRRAVVTGANSGLGLHTAFELARHGADVIMAVRDQAKGEQAHNRISTALRSNAGSGRVSLAALDLADLASVRAFADEQADVPLHLLVNNAGVMAIPRRETADGFEMQLGTNHLGHAALTFRLLPALVAAGAPGPASRVVTVSSGMHRRGRMDFDDLMGERSYKPWTAYGQSKLANLLFMAELERRLEDAGLPVASYGAHPGYADTNLQSVGPRMSGSAIGERMTSIGNRLLAQPASQGALPTLYAATVEGLPPGSYVGPDGLFEQRGHPQVVGRSKEAQSTADAARLWDVTEELVGIRFQDVVSRIDAAQG